MSDEPKFCKDCRYYSTDRQWQHCSHIRVVNRVTGEPGFADIQRGYSTSACGAEGRLWEAKAANLVNVIQSPERPRRWWGFWK